jgi:hypothetical protein
MPGAEGRLKIVARAIALAAMVLGLFLVTRTYRLERAYAEAMPHQRDLPARRTVQVLVTHRTPVFVTDAEAKLLETSRTYVAFGWPFIVLGILLVAASREHSPPAVEVAPERESPAPR